MSSTALRVETRTDVGVLGATGVVGQQLIRLLAVHPWFKPAWLAASERSTGAKYAHSAAWHLSTPCPDEVAERSLEPCLPGRGPRLVFSALDADSARDIEPAFAAAGHIVVSNARTFRMDPAVPLLIPEVNADHLEIVSTQRRERRWSGAIVTNPNCSTVILAMVLAALRQFGISSAFVTTLQAVSGAGYPGVPSLDILANVIPAIAGEEEKIETETQKILGILSHGTIVNHPVVVSAHTTRVPVLDGHTETMSIQMEERPSVEDVCDALATWRPLPQQLGLPSAPASPIVLSTRPDRPQPRLDVNHGDGMSVTVGRVRACPLFGIKCVALGHNTIRGAAGAGVLNAELMHAEGLLGED